MICLQFSPAYEVLFRLVISLGFKTARCGRYVVPTSQMRRTGVTETGTSPWSLGSWVERWQALPVPSLAVLETAEGVRWVLWVPLTPLNQSSPCFSIKESENSWCLCSGTPWGWEGLNYSSTTELFSHDVSLEVAASTCSRELAYHPLTPSDHR